MRKIFALILFSVFLLVFEPVGAQGSVILEFMGNFMSSGLSSKVNRLNLYADSQGVNLFVEACPEVVSGLMEHFSHRPGMTITAGPFPASPFVQVTWDERGVFQVPGLPFFTLDPSDPEYPGTTSWSWQNPLGQGVVAQNCATEGQKVFARDFVKSPFTWFFLLLTLAVAGIAVRRRQAEPQPQIA